MGDQARVHLIVREGDVMHLNLPSALSAVMPSLCSQNLVDPASSYMLVSKIKPCMSQHLSLSDTAANGSLEQT
jgi:hypothetical protein